MIKLPVDLDHAGITTRDLAPLRARWERIGFMLTDPAELHSGNVAIGQSSCHVMFERTYIELTAIHGGLAGNHLEPWLTDRFGLMLLLLGGDLGAARHAATAAGLAASAIAPASRAVNYDGNGTAHFNWFGLDASHTPEGLVGFVEHVTPEIVFSPVMRGHSNGATKLLGMILEGPDPTAMARRYEPFADTSATTELHFRVGPLPRMCGLVIKVTDLNLAEQALPKDLPYTRAKTHITIPEAAGLGCELIFRL